MANDDMITGAGGGGEIYAYLDARLNRTEEKLSCQFERLDNKLDKNSEWITQWSTDVEVRLKTLQTEVDSMSGDKEWKSKTDRRLDKHETVINVLLWFIGIVIGAILLAVIAWIGDAVIKINSMQQIIPPIPTAIFTTVFQ